MDDGTTTTHNHHHHHHHSIYRVETWGSEKLVSHQESSSRK
jgi:hypothetical protein